MLLVIVNWIYVLFIAYSYGNLVNIVSYKMFGYRMKNADAYVMSGLVAATVYAQVFSLFGGVGLLANVILAAGAVLSLCVSPKGTKENFCEIRNHTNGVCLIVTAVLFVLWAYFSSRGYIHYDSDLYHGQSIRWIEEYGVVPGLGNLHNRLAYNSASFALSALFSMKFLFGTSMHSMSGFFAFLLSVSCIDVYRNVKRKKLHVSDYLRCASVYYLFTLTEEVVSPASDYFIMLVVFYIVIRWVTLLEEKEESFVPYAWLCVCGVFALTLKLTAGLVLLLTLKPLVRMIKEKKYSAICFFLICGIVVLVPWMVRNVIISGWLVYPFPALDLFRFEWKMDAVGAANDAKEIMVWGRGVYDVSLAGQPVWEWFLQWFNDMLSGTQKLLIIGCALSIAAFAVDVVAALIKKKKDRFDFALVFITVAASYLYWQLSAPLFRYGYAYVLLTVALMGGFLLSKLKKDRVIFALIALYGCYKLVVTGIYAEQTMRLPYYLETQTYQTYEMVSYEQNGIVFYAPAVGDRTGYEPFPAAPYREHFTLRGDSLEDGFLPRK